MIYASSRFAVETEVRRNCHKLDSTPSNGGLDHSESMQGLAAEP
jgi:hypothetical protein